MLPGTSSETSRRERLAVGGEQECHIVDGQGVQQRRQIRMLRDHQHLAGLDLLDPDAAILAMLPPHDDRIGAALSGVEHQPQRQARLRPDRPPILELPDLFFRQAWKPSLSTSGSVNDTGGFVRPNAPAGNRGRVGGRMPSAAQAS